MKCIILPMPNGTTHARATFLLAVAGGLAAYYQFHQPLLPAMAMTGGALTGMVLTPDLDVDNGCISARLIRQTAGNALANLWLLLWKPYSLLMPHRSPLSHYPLLGTAVRLLYLAIMPALIYFFSSGQFAVLRFPPWGWWAVAGLVAADTLHFIMDQIS